MSEISIGKKVPDFALQATPEQVIELSKLKGKNIVLFFYPKDNTPGCTKEAQDFRDHISEFNKLNTLVLGISRDSIKSHNNFKEKQCLPFELLSDESETVCHLFNVIKVKNKYGKQVRGIERSTFLIDKDGLLQQEWRNVKVDNHIADVLKAINAL